MKPSLDDIPAGVLRLSENLVIEAANTGAAELTNRRAETLIGEAFDVLLTAAARILFQTHVYPALRADGRVQEVFLTLQPAQGPHIPVLMNGTRSERNGQTVYDVLLVRILARSRWEQDLLAATRALEQEREASDRLARDLAATANDLARRFADEQRTREFRDAFIAVISHELRTPITTIYGMSQRLLGRYEQLPVEVVHEHLADIASDAERLRRLTEDLLILSRAEGGRLTVADESMAVGHILRAVVHAESARTQDHQFELEISPGLPVVLGEDGYVEQVIRNFLSNAVKYSPPGTTIVARAVPEDGGLAVRVVDAGPGLGDESPDQLFELFYRASSAAKQAPGAGIGLFVCKTLIEAMNGRIWARNAAAVGKPSGAEFGFWLPAAAD